MPEVQYSWAMLRALSSTTANYWLLDLCSHDRKECKELSRVCFYMGTNPFLEGSNPMA
jgi:hypothetical protein